MNNAIFLGDLHDYMRTCIWFHPKVWICINLNRY